MPIHRYAQAGRYAQADGLFDHGRLVAAHTSEKIGDGAGDSAAERIGVDHPIVREHLARIGAHLCWHGGLTSTISTKMAGLSASSATREPWSPAMPRRAGSTCRC